MTLRHAWTVKVVRWHRTASTGKGKGAHPLAVTQYSCSDCGATLPENHGPLPWWSQPGPWPTCAEQLRGEA